MAAMRVLVVDEAAERAEVLRAALLLAGYEVTASLTSPLTLLKTIERLEPEVILIDTDSPSRDVLEHLVMVRRHTPRPVVMFASDGKRATIRAATRAGVSAYVVDGLVFLAMHWGGRFLGGYGINGLTIGALDPLSRQPDFGVAESEIDAFAAASKSLAKLQAKLKCGSCLPELRRKLAA